MSSDKSEEEEHEAISKQIVDYYKKYSQNKHLPKYFSGTSLSYMPPIVKDDEIETRTEPIVILDETSSETLVQKEPIPSIQIDEPAELKPLSPASSITSNRKLEWDNGADIGYNNCNKNVKLHKSASLPILSKPFDAKNVDKKVTNRLCTEIVTVISYCGDGRGDDNQIQSSSSSSLYPAEAPIESSSSSNKTNPKPISSSSSSVQTNLKQLSSSSSSFSNTLAYLKTKIGCPDAESTPKLSSGLVYAETPIIPKKKKAKCKNKIINLCKTKPVLVECLDNQKKKRSDKEIQTTFVENASKCVQTSDSLEILPPKNPAPRTIENQSVIFIHYDSESDKRTCSSNTQTDDIIASHCDSFEYYKQEYIEEAKNGVLKRSSPKSDLAASTDSSKDLPILGQLISTKQSKSVIGDVDRSIDLLQKLLKSKKYDATTKKRYIKKIVEKIVDTKYSEDSTTSSELFVPKKQNLQENLPWHPPQLSKFTVKTFSDEFLPSEEKKSLEVNQSENKSSLDGDNTGTSLEKQQNSSSGSYQSWKEEKTLSERILEEKQRGQGDHLVKYALKERQHQIDWIKDEITHLTKLKGLLEKKVQRTTTVYMVSQHYDENPCGSICPQRVPPRNYVIQTEFSSSSSEVPTDYNLFDGKGKTNYRVTDGTSKSPDLDINAKLVGDIKVVSDDKTTNIKVQAKRIDPKDSERFKPKQPVLFGGGKYDTFPRSRAEEKCFPCGRIKSVGKAEVGAEDRSHLSLEVPLDSQSSFAKRVDAFINKISAGSSVDSHKCKCLDILNKKLKDRELAGTSGKPQLLKIDLDQPCHCCGFQKPTKTDTIECQTDVCNCSNKQGQPCHCCGRQKPTKTDTIECQTDDCNCSNKQVQPCRCGREKRTKTDTIECQTDDCKYSNKQVQPCLCCGRKKPTTTDTTECQTDDCNCPNKQVQTSVGCKDKCVETCKCVKDSSSSKDESVKTGSGGSEDGSGKTSSGSSKSSSGSGTGTETESTSESVRSCMCCKRKNVSSKRLYALRKRLSDEAYPLCRPCYRQNRGTVYSPNFFTNPGHVCSCYTVVETKTLNEIKETINDLNELETFCTCLDVDDRSKSEYCKYCKCKLKKTSKNKNGIAYMLTFENASFNGEKERKKRKKKQYLEEIKIKIPVSYKKKHKDKENNKKKKSKRSESEETSSSAVPKKKTYNLQEYLNQNRPNFVEVAEDRRNTVNQARMQREEFADYNKLMFLKKCQEECEKNAKRLFSAKEMKEITKRNYKKLPEVQKKLNDNRDKQLRQASRLMADTFNKKLRENVLKGKRNLPMDVKVVNT